MSDENGQTAVEYAVVLATVAIVIALGLALIPSDLFGTFWSSVSDALT